MKENGRCRKDNFILALIFAAASVWFMGVILNPAAVKASPKAYELILPDSAVREYSESEIRDMSAQVVCYAKNEIYAWHGRKFVSDELTAYFREQPWYYGNIEGADFSDDLLNGYEKKNVQLLVEREKELGAYELDQPGYSFDPVYDYVYGWSSAAGGLSATYPAIDSGIVYVKESRLLSTANFCLTIPESWGNGWGYEAASEDSLKLYCALAKATGEAPGTLCTILRTKEYQPEDYYPSASYLGDKDGYYYYMLEPTDVQYNVNHATAAAEYRTMQEDVSEIPLDFKLF